MKPTFETVLEELQAALDRAAQAEAEVVELRRVVNKAEAAVWADPGDAGGAVLHGQLEEALEALASPSPVAKAMAQVVEAARKVVWRHWNPMVDREVHRDDFMERMCDLRDALLAARKGEG